MTTASFPLPTGARFADWVERRADGEPVAYVIGKREFYGRDFFVAPGVLIPRPETELLVDAVQSEFPQVGAGDTAIGEATAATTVLDLGTGSGCIAISIALEYPSTRVTAVDQSDFALAVTARNATTLGATVGLLESDWFSALAGARFDLIVSNPPYIRADDPHLCQGDLRHEPGSALASGDDGLSALRWIIGQAPEHLNPGGWLWLEHGYDQAEAVRALLRSAGFADVSSRRDLAGIERISGGVWAGSA
ncbi:MAG: peptide chain release factor N(5)-glutamine methyltransferase [Rhodocyclaceae bacterium]|nr:peptide chain release factor N(5)-glutamine methyltransferase [Rhodocyclaceae bacterium]